MADKEDLRSSKRHFSGPGQRQHRFSGGKGGDSTEALPVSTDKEEETAEEAVANGLVAVANVA